MNILYELLLDICEFIIGLSV